MPLMSMTSDITSQSLDGQVIKLVQNLGFYRPKPYCEAKMATAQDQRVVQPKIKIDYMASKQNTRPEYGTRQGREFVNTRLEYGTRQGRDFANTRPEYDTRGNRDFANTRPENGTRQGRDFANTRPEYGTRQGRDFAYTRPEYDTRGNRDFANTRPEYDTREGRDFAGTLHCQYKPTPSMGQIRPNLWDENAALKAQLKHSQLEEQQCHHKYVAAEKKASDLKTQLGELHRKYSNTAAADEKTIKELKHQLELACSLETKSFMDGILKLKLELSEARNEQINSSDRQIQCNSAAEWCEEPPAWSTKASQTDLEDQTTGDERLSTEELQQKLQKAQQDLEEQAAQHSKEQEALRCETEDLRAKLCTVETLKEKNVVKALELEMEIQSIKISFAEQLEQQQIENKKVLAALTKAEEEKTSLQKTLKVKQEEWSQAGADMETRLVKLESMMSTLLEEKAKMKKKSWLVRLFGSRITKA
ncbi:synaptonemal complex protein 1-like isoform X1 [Thunnus maccoyii]|uniref:synaptonemal complex protein 1-like isoform X1 n=1 Tax=Thunnus maccoyii TaxID=8240 RepID=UPI001C4CB31B|nr:synaptonemal complex protein 1-like isoform X1 [Thunnus maccoyii]